MSDDPFDDTHDAPPTPEEVAAARRLAEALEEGGATADDTIAAARLLQAIAAEGRDDLAERRLRRELVREAGRARRVRRERFAAAAAIVLAAGATVLLMARHRPAQGAALAAREAEARLAVARLLGEGAPARRIDGITEELRDARLETLWRSRFDSVLGTLGTSGTAPSPTPGGPAS